MLLDIHNKDNNRPQIKKYPAPNVNSSGGGETLVWAPHPGLLSNQKEQVPLLVGTTTSLSENHTLLC